MRTKRNEPQDYDGRHRGLGKGDDDCHTWLRLFSCEPLGVVDLASVSGLLLLDSRIWCIVGGRRVVVAHRHLNTIIRCRGRCSGVRSGSCIAAALIGKLGTSHLPGCSS